MPPTPADVTEPAPRRRSLPVPPEAPGARSAEPWSFEFTTLTPMMGGGLVGGVPNPIRPITAQTVRGHLRFWWRATVGAQHADTAALREAEQAIWGGPKCKSRVTLGVTLEAKQLPAPTRAYASLDRPWGFKKYDAAMYALFPGRPPEGEGPQNGKQLIELGLGFTVNITISDFPADPSAERVEAAIFPALRAWANFGGVGARTRRGVGAIWSEQLAFESPQEASKFVARYARPGVRPWPTLAAVVAREGFEDTSAAWNDVVGQLRDFRQGEDHARDDRFGRSRWPEPEAIRNAPLARGGARLGFRRHLDLKHPLGFPRAALGLPIVFNFKKYEQPEGGRKQPEPPPSTLTPARRRVDARGEPMLGARGEESWEDLERMASPVLLRPARLAPREAGQVSHVAFIVRLTNPGLEGVKLITEGAPPVWANARGIVAPEFGDYTHTDPPGAPVGHPSPMNIDGTPHSDAVDAFLAFVKRTRIGDRGGYA